MRITMKYRETDSRGSFVAWGIGFNYKYNANAYVLDILDRRSLKPLLFIDFDRQQARSALTYVSMLEKALQIQALMLSNNMTLDLSFSFDEARLAALLESAALQARYAFDLSRGQFYRFSFDFIRNNGLKALSIKKYRGSSETGAPFYSGQLTTDKNKSVRASGHSLPTMIKALSDKIVSDLVTLEFGYRSEDSAHNLLLVASKLGVMSRILDQNFAPSGHALPFAEDAPLDSISENA